MDNINAVYYENKNKFDWYSLISAALMLLIGVAMLIWPGESSHVIAYIVAVLIALAGVILIIVYFARKERVPLFSLGSLSVGLTLLLVGILLLAIPDVFIGILPVLLGCFLIFSGFNSLQTTIELVRLRVTNWYIPLIFAAVAIICGVLSLLNPFVAANALMIFLGISLVVESILMVVSLILFRSKG